MLINPKPSSHETSSSESERRILYWLLGAAFALIMAGLGLHANGTSEAIDKLDERVYQLTMEVRKLTP